MLRALILTILSVCLLGAAAEDDRPRVVALSPALAVTLGDLGLTDTLVGRHGWDSISDQSLPVCGDQSGIDYERLLAVRPTHVYIQWGARPVPDRLSELGRRRGWTVRNIDLLTLDDVAGSVRTLAGDLAPAGDERAARLLADIERAFDQRGPHRFTGTVLVLASVNPAGAVGPGSFHHQIIERLGLRPALTEGGPWQTLDREDLVTIDPAAIVLIQPEGDAASPDLGVLDGLPLRAIRDDRLLVITDPALNTPSSALVRFAEMLGSSASSWGPADLD